MTSFCPICKAPIRSSQILCDACKTQLDGECFDALLSRCPRCDYPILAQDYRCTMCQEPDFAKVHCVARYDGSLSYAVLDSFKFHSESSLASVVALYLSRAIEKLDPRHEALLVPIPCNKESLKRNGWDHMLMVCRHLDRPYMQLLIQGKDRPQQKRLDRKGRMEGSLDRFKINSHYEKDLESLKSRKVIVIDDICTTMSTIKSGIRTLKDMGFTDVMGASWLLDILASGDDFQGNMF